MKYDLEMYNCEPGEKYFQVILIEIDVGPVAKVSNRPKLENLPSDIKLTPGMKLPPLPFEMTDDEEVVISSFEYEWIDTPSKERFLEFLRNHSSQTSVNIRGGKDISEAQRNRFHMDAVIADLLDLVWIRHNKKLAEENTLYCLDTDEAGTVRVAPNPNDNMMRRALELVFGDGCVTILNDTLPANPEEFLGFTS